MTNMSYGGGDRRLKMKSCCLLWVDEVMADEEGADNKTNKMIALLTKFWASTVFPTCVPSKHRT